MAVPKLERLLTLVNVLMASPRHLSALEVRRRVPGYAEDDDSFRRGFERDKAELREMGIPFDMGEVPNTDPPIVGYRILSRDCTLRDPGLEDDELDALRLAVALVGSGDGAGQRALHKLGGGVSGGTPRTELPADPDLVAAFTGVSERRRLRFAYRGVERVLDPYRLQFARDRWYLLGHDHTRDDLRWFRLGRVDGAIAVEGPAAAFDRPAGETPGLQLAPWLVGGSDTGTVAARVWFDADIAPTVRTELGDAEIESDDEHGLVAIISVANREAFRSWLLAFLDRAEVLGPEDLRAEVVEWLEGLVS
jgi:proteasome accessory factor B